MTNPTTCPQCNTVNTGRSNADFCPACGFKYADRRPTEIAKNNQAVATAGYIIAALAGTVVLIGYLSGYFA